MSASVSDLTAEERAVQDEQETKQAERVDRPPAASEHIPPAKIYQPLSFPVVALLMPGAVFGTLARLGLVALMTYDGNSIFALAYAQAVGCLVIGITMRFKEPLGQLYAPLYTGITTGFCGSLTTFSTWQWDVFSAWINADGFHRGGFKNVGVSPHEAQRAAVKQLLQFLDGVAQSTITFSLSLASLAFGYNIAALIVPHPPKPRLLRKPIRYGLSLLATLTYAATFLTYFLLPASVRHKATAALIFSFPGVLTRYFLSLTLNQRFRALPAGTLAANILGTSLLAAFHLIQRLNTPVSHSACSVLEGLIDGYCGCLTTISTFAAELRDLPGWRAVRYALVSWVLGQVVIVLIYGGPLWTGHAKEHLTCTFQQ